ncbi:DUF805 domain-containing protein [Alkalihalobacillus sp. AL-G]|uniref:DUF805 domain-containing protein n=1 Tax=Alkalihalobacillus sp. AL-G TaxID=2926399 RepID=UPI00272B8257|nr:DUF805 domain-containing protein [Alkalihalobacillus sp. AL-G]WLD93341.1 DUF805 domain-containing protein [Alkalihalobacillus sp. AL-G]
MQWYLKVIKNYVKFEGRARRKEYWMFVLFNFLISLAVSLIGMAFDADTLLSILYSLAVLLPSLAVSVRRLHDIGRTGWWILISLVPLIGAIVLLVFNCLDSESTENQYGPNPKLDPSL